MSQTKPTTEEHRERAAELRKASDLIDDVARDTGGSVDGVLRDAEAVVENVATVLEEEDGDITREELIERIYPTGGSR